MGNSIVAQLKEKFDQYALWDIAGHFFKLYKHMEGINAPEIQFKDGRLPSDEGFKTLLMVKNALSKEGVVPYLPDTMIRDLLEVPFSQVEAATTAICLALDYPAEVVCKWYKDSAELFLITKEDVAALDAYLSAALDRSVYRHFFKAALLLGVEETRDRLTMLFDAVGIYAEEVLYELYCRGVVRGYLFHTYYTDPISAMKHLQVSGFNCETIAHILKTDPDYLRTFSDGNSLMSGYALLHADQLVAAYQKQLLDATDLDDMKAFASKEEKRDEMWEAFKVEYERIRKGSLSHPLCPRLQRALIGVVTEFENLGIVLPQELRRYSLK